jgi:thioester reductase-like protein
MARTILITGATGAVGTEVAARLAAAGHSVIGMVHQTREFVRGSGRRLPAGAVVPLSGDITTPGLGLSSRQRSELRGRVDLIVHCAAMTDFGRDPAVYDTVNVDGTARIIEFATSGSRSAAPLVHVSTAYVCGERDGVISEAELDTGQRFANHYENSKFRAELAVRAAAEHGLPAVVVRPSIVTGAARTGVIRDFSNMYVVLRVLTRGLVRTIPGHYDAVIDLVPIDFVADAIGQVCERFDDAAGHTLHLTGAPPLTLRDFSDVMAEFPSLHVPRYVPPYGFEPTLMPDLERRYYERVVALYESYFRRRAVFDTSTAQRLIEARPAAGGRPYLRRLLRYGMRAGYFLPAPPPACAQPEPRTTGGAVRQ